MLDRRKFLGVLGGVAALPLGLKQTVAEEYPSRPLRILVGFAAGGNFDLVARIIAEEMSARLKQPVIVENRPGASSNIAAEAALRAPADGYTLFLAGAVNAINATLYDKLPFNFANDFTPISGAVQFPDVMTVSQSFPVRSVSGIHCLCEGKSRQGQPRVLRQRHDATPRRRAFQDRCRRQLRSRALSRRLAGADRSAWWPDSGPFRGNARLDPTH